MTVTPADVAAYAPEAPPVTAAQVQEAQDWADPYLAGLTLSPGSRQEREARRAVCAYAASLAASGKATGARLSGKSAATRIEVGDLKVERAQGDAQEVAAGMVTSADEYRARAWRHLRAAGGALWGAAVGAAL